MATDSIGVGVADKLRGSRRSSSRHVIQQPDAVELDPVSPALPSADPSILPKFLSALHECRNSGNRIADALEGIQQTLARLTDYLAPEPEDIVGTDFIAKRLDCTLVWVAEMVRKGDIPKHCIVPGTGNGKVWKFYRRHVDAWLNNR